MTILIAGHYDQRFSMFSDKNLNETLERVFRHIEKSAKGGKSENSFTDLFYGFDINSNKLSVTYAKRNKHLAKLLNSSVKDHNIDMFGDTYEYLTTMYASNAEKSAVNSLLPQMLPNCLPNLELLVNRLSINIYRSLWF